MTKKEWAYTLKVGDIVHDCKGEYLKIKELIDQESDNPYDIGVVLEDDSYCSVMNCLSPANESIKLDLS